MHTQINHPYTVVKIGGTTGVDFEAICDDVASQILAGEKIILVHGGSESANALGEAVGSPAQFVTSPSGFTSRYTDQRTLEIFTMAVNGKVNTGLVAGLQARGVNALGISGVDGKLLQARRKSTIRVVENGKRKVLRGDFSGKIIGVNVHLLQTLVEAGFVPVIAPLAVTDDGQIVNVDADRAAAMIAGALAANTLLLLSAIPGLLKHFPDERSLIAHLPQANLDDALVYAKGRMKKKVLGAKEALLGGVDKVVIGDGRIPSPISTAISGKGTVIS